MKQAAPRALRACMGGARGQPATRTRTTAAHGQRLRRSAEGTTIPTNIPPCGPADWSDLKVREITRAESQDGNCLSLLVFSQPFMAVHCLPFGSPDVPEKSLRERNLPPGCKG
jgi:hypothetical protein